MSTQGSRFWHAAFRLTYRILALIDPLVRAMWQRQGMGNVVELEVPRRSNPQTSRRRMVGILHADGRSYIGHPNGDVGWTRDLAVATEGTIHYFNGTTWQFNATPLERTEEREHAIRATSQHPFPGNLVYRLGRRQVRAAGVYFRLSDRHNIG